MKFYTKLALTNIKNNRKIYIPYLMTCIFTVCLHYIVACLAVNKGIAGHDTITSFMNMGRMVIVVFSFIFLLYTNSFIIKRRKKEIGVYNVLGMEKKHIMIMVFIETIMISFITLLIGIGLGIILTQLMYMVLTYIVQLTSGFVFEIPVSSLMQTVVVFCIIFIVSLLFNLFQVKVSNPIELMKGGHFGEKEPKTKILMTIIGFICLGFGYYLAISIEDPMTAIMIFFGAVILVMVGTYCLFTAGSIAILKLLKRNKRFYYQTKHFTSVSGMIYRMKQNAVGLANICILCTCVLVTLSSTICLYAGIEDSVDKQCPSDFYFIDYNPSTNNILEIAKLAAKQANINYDELYQLHYYDLFGYKQDNGYIELDRNKIDSINYYNLTSINIINEEDYNKAFHQNTKLKDDEVVLYSNYDFKENEILLADMKYNIVGRFDNEDVMMNSAYAPSNLAIVVNQNAYNTLSQMNQLDGSVEKLGIIVNAKNVTSEQWQHMEKVMNDKLNHNGYMCSNKETLKETNYEAYGGLMFIGIFLSIMFMMAAILIIYYKQLTEGYEDKQRFEILQNVGMSQKEVKQTIRSQVLIFFFLPLIVAIIHVAFAYPLMVNVLNAFLMGNSRTYFMCIVGCIFGLIVIYSLVYTLTAKIYYQIVKH